MKLIKIILTFLLIAISIIPKLFNIDTNIINIIIIILSTLYIFVIANSNNSKSDMINYIIVFLFWNITFSLVRVPELKKANLTELVLSTISLKYIYLDIFPSLAIGSILCIITKRKKVLNIILQIILIILSYKLNNIIFFYTAVFLLSYLLRNNIRIKSPSNQVLSIVSNISLGTYLVHDIIITLILHFNIVSVNNIPDYIGAVILTYILGLIFTFGLKVRPIIRMII